MYAILGLGATAFFLCLILVPVCRDVFLRYQIVDIPDDDRKLHPKPVPRIGGIPIVISYAGALCLMLFFAPHGAQIYIQHRSLLWLLLPATAVIFITGLIDDLFDLAPKWKLFGQFLGASLAVALGARITVFHSHLYSPWVSIPLSLFWLIGCTNAVNLIDGLDGLASGVGLFATIAAILAAVVSGNLGLAAATVPLAGCLLAFLRYNFSPASIFLGDCGSLTIGFMLGCFGLIWSQRSGSLLDMAAPMMVLALPLVDVGLSIGRRVLRGVPVFKGDRGHIHHMILARGFKPGSATLILYSVCFLAAFFALLQSYSRPEFRMPIIGVFCSLIWVGINYLGYVEFDALRKTLSRKSVLRSLHEEIYLHELRRSIEDAETVESLWSMVRSACNDMAFATAQMYFLKSSFEATFIRSAIDPSWKMNIALGKQSHLVLTRTGEDPPPRLMISMLVLLQEAMSEKEITLAGSLEEESEIISGAA
jgi:UDP-GlcNAc:undecaprenyl-phosphate/decaprenyl-phosphate GlcNAc-1-phosphate transferase